MRAADDIQEWVLAEVRQAASETDSWPEWMKDTRWWHPTLGRELRPEETTQ